MRKRILYTLIAAAVLSISGCAGRGLIYTHTVEPLTRNHRSTTIVQSSAKGSIKRFDIRIAPLDFEWSTNAIGDIARKHGMKEVYFADQETLSFFGVWTQRTVRIYGQ